MNNKDLIRFLLDEGIKEELDVLSRLIAIHDLSNFTATAQLTKEAAKIDWKRTVFAASILAKGSEREPREAALRIATAAVILSTDTAIQDAGAILFEKLSNQRALWLSQEKAKIQKGLFERLGISSRLQSAYRHLESTILVDSTGEFLPANDFQRDFWNKANGKRTWLSASAPTACGKSYIVLRRLLNSIATSEAQVAAYIAPTRALVAEISENLNAMIFDQGINHITVSTLPLKNHFKEELEKSKKVIFVLTQERLHLLANVAGDQFFIDILIVDEAHKIGDRLRGVILQDAIERVVRANSNAEVIFVSPSTQNPDELLSDAPRNAVVSSVDSDLPTVVQNVILAKQAPRKPTEWNLSLQRGDDELNLGVLHLAARPTSFKKRLAFIAAAAAAENGTLVYANTAAEAEEVALLISQLISKNNDKDSELAALAQLARKGVHNAYQLAALVESGIAFHYGNMPSLIRTEIERLFRIGKIRFLVCTSTLIEGVNLACRTIVVRGPKKGIGKPMQPQDFWNLAGRAGRWGHEFQGNIICIDPNNADAWPTGVPKRARYPILREADSVIHSTGELQTYIENRYDAPMEEVGKQGNSQYEQVSAYLISNFMREGSIISAPFAKRHDANALKSLDKSLSKVSEHITIPAGIISRHPGVNAVGMQRLLNHFVSSNGDVEQFLPAPPESDDAYKRLVGIMTCINNYIYPAFFPHTLIPLHALVTIEWMRGLSLAAIISKRIKYNRKNGRDYDLAELFRNTMKLVEETARFRSPKYIAAYMDILSFHLKNIGRQDLVEDELDYGLMLEFGLSTRTLISLMELGLSRMSAVELYEKMARDDLDQEGVKAWVAEFGPHLESLDVPSLIIKEVKNRIGGWLSNEDSTNL